MILHLKSEHLLGPTSMELKPETGKEIPFFTYVGYGEKSRT